MIPALKDKIETSYPYKCELHAHTLPISPCSEYYPSGLIETYKSLGVSAIVLTNHMTPNLLVGKDTSEFAKEYTDAFAEFKACAEENGINAIFGIELRFAENFNDYLIFGVSPDDTSEIIGYIDKGLAYFREHFMRDGILLIQAHPKRDRMTETDPSLLDGIEAFNMHPGHNSRVAFAVTKAKDAGLIITGGTDFHHPGHEGACLLRTSLPLTTEKDLVNILRSRDYALDVRGSIILP